MLLLFRRQIAPGLLLLPQAGLLLRRHAVPLIELLPDLGLFVGRKILECAAVLQDALTLLRSEVAHRIDPRTRRAHTHLLTVVQSRATCIGGGTALVIEIVLRLRMCVSRIRIRWTIDISVGRTIRIRVRLLLRMRLLRRVRRRLRRTVIVLLLCPGCAGKRGKAGQRQNQCAELEILPHVPFAASPARAAQRRSCMELPSTRLTRLQEKRYIGCCWSFGDSSFCSAGGKSFNGSKFDSSS